MWFYADNINRYDEDQNDEYKRDSIEKDENKKKKKVKLHHGI